MEAPQAINVSMIRSTVDYDRKGVQHGALRVSHSVHRSAYGSIDIPIAVFSNGLGPTVLLTSGVHGDEYEGPIALAKLVRKLVLNDVSGRIIVVPTLNHPAFLAASRVSPIDGINLNRTFPGKRDGTVTEMIAHYVTAVLLPMADYVFDFHAGGSSLNYLPCVLAPLPGQGARPEEVEALLKAMSPPRVLRFDSERAMSGEDRVISNYATKSGALFLTGEFGGGAIVNLEGLATVEAGLTRFLTKVGALNAESALAAACSSADVGLGSASAQSFVMDDPGLFAHATRPGFFEPTFRLGDHITAGSPAGYIYNNNCPWEEPTRINFGSDGIALCIRTLAQVEVGDCLGHLGRPMEPSISYTPKFQASI